MTEAERYVVASEMDRVRQKIAASQEIAKYQAMVSFQKASKENDRAAAIEREMAIRVHCQCPACRPHNAWYVKDACGRGYR